jgi:hypothetical protein
MVVMNFRALKELLQFITDNLEIVRWVRTFLLIEFIDVLGKLLHG